MSQAIPKSLNKKYVSWGFRKAQCWVLIISLNDLTNRSIVRDVLINVYAFNQNFLIVNASESKFMIIGSHKKLQYCEDLDIALKIEINTLERCIKFGLLGVVIDEFLIL